MSNSDARRSTIHHEKHPLRRDDIANKRSILAELDAFHGHPGRPPAVEFIFVETVQPDVPFVPACSCLGWGGWGFSFGHAACRYTRPDGTQRLVNITKGTGDEGEGELVEFWEAPEDYLFGVRGEPGKGGVFARPIALIRIPEWDDDAVMAIDYWFKSVMAAFRRRGRRERDPPASALRGRGGDDDDDDDDDGGRRRRRRAAVGFNLFAQLVDALALLLPGRQRRRGNCASWTSHALFFAGLLERPHGFPKATFVDLFEHHVLDACRARLPPSAKVTYLRQAAAGRAERKWQVYDLFPSTVAPQHFFANWMYRDLERFADVVVEVVEEEEELADEEEAAAAADQGRGGARDAAEGGEDCRRRGGGGGGTGATRLVAKLRAGRARRPTFLRCGPCAYCNHLLLLCLGAVWIRYGWPNRGEPRETMYAARALFVLVVFILNAILS